ncbi:MAG: CPBP family intramembrane metalloprotease [Candidatus Kapabacteria bacterium]|nr:CPBP family intramembrane metalloprotease [Candidatus Kapabacteria bacterium]
MTDTILQKYLSFWWVRIIAFIFLSAITTFVLLLSGLPVEENILVYGVLITVSFLVEMLRQGGSPSTLGFHTSRFTIQEILFGIAISLGTLCLIAIIGILFGATVGQKSYNEGIGSFLVVSLIIVLFATGEEFIFRGVIFQALVQRFNPSLITFITSLLFAAAHLFNPHISVVGFINIFLANVLLCSLFLKTTSLIAPITYHAVWNWGQHVLLGSPVSGLHFGISLFKVDFAPTPDSLEWLFADSFGVEQGILTTIFLIASIVLTNLYLKQSPYIAAKLYNRDVEESKLQNANLNG